MSSRIRKIIQEYFNHSYSERIQKAFTLWLKDACDKDEKDEGIKETWDAIDKLDIKADESTEKAFSSLMAAIQASAVSAKAKRRPFMHKLSRIAAILMLPVISAAITYFVMNSPPVTGEELSMIECIVPDGEIRTVTLPDSSVVTVNSGSILIYPQKFTAVRNIFLNGEAYFKVTRDETKPFIVKTTDLDVEVLGTTFNISSYSDSEFSTATLVSGSVNVRFKHADKATVVLLPNEQIAYDRLSGTIEKSRVKVEDELAWTEGNLIIQRMTIDEVIKIIERKYAMKVYLNSSNYNKERITMKATHGETITEFMEVLQYLLPKLKYKIEEDRLFIY